MLDLNQAGTIMQIFTYKTASVITFNQTIFDFAVYGIQPSASHANHSWQSRSFPPLMTYNDQEPIRNHVWMYRIANPLS